jgi:hypothetical protein
MNIVDSNMSGLQGIQQGLNRVREGSEIFTRSVASAEESKAISSLIDIKLGELQVYSSAKVLQVGDDIQRTLLNIVA